MVSVKWCVHHRRGGRPTMCKNHVQTSSPQTLSSCRQSFCAFSVQCEQAARTYPVMTSRSCMRPPYRISCVPWHNTAISLATSRGSFRVVGDTAVFQVVWRAIGDGVVVCRFNLRARHLVLVLWRCLQICLAGASVELGTLLLTGLAAATTDRRHVRRNAQ